MPKKRFTEKDIEQLLGHYRSERRRLVFQLDAVRKSIKDLRSIKTTGSSSAVAPVKRGPGRPRKTDGPVRRGRKPGRKKKRTIKEGGYRLNPWDQNEIDPELRTASHQAGIAGQLEEMGRQERTFRSGF